MQELWIATSNKGKFKEIKELLKALPYSVHAAFELPNYASPHESGTTFEENAKIKARFLRALKSDALVIADDSGLEVDALKGLPGVHSARYAGPKARDIENTLKVIKQISLQSAGDARAARFRCVICLIDASGTEHLFSGSLEGDISRDMRGTTGFGYDPIFVPKGETKTLAELGMAVKNRLSHRAAALRGLVEHLKSSPVT